MNRIIWQNYIKPILTIVLGVTIATLDIIGAGAIYVLLIKGIV